MPDMPARQCGSCYFVRQIAGRLCCVRNPPAPDPVTAQARWPIVQPTDRCGRHRPKPEIRKRDQGSGVGDQSRTIGHAAAPIANQKSNIKNQKSDASAPNHKSKIINHKFDGLPVFADQFGDYCKIPLTQGKFAKVDPEDYVWLSQFRWCCKMNVENCYAVRNVQTHGRSKRIYMHRLIRNTPDHLVCDHENHDGLDNRKRNCRNCTTAQNNANRRKCRTASSQYLGVSYNKRRRKWIAHIKDQGKERYLGSYDIEADAARAYDRAAVAIHGPYAALNFPHETATNNESHQSHESNGDL